MWEPLALAIILITIFWSLRYDDGRFFFILLIGFSLRLAIIPIYPHISGADIADYSSYFIHFSSLVDRRGTLWAIQEFVDIHVPFYTILYPGHIYNIYDNDGVILIRIINTSLSLITIPLLNEINKNVFGCRFKRWQAGLLLFWPSFVYLSVEVGRTVPSILFVMMAVYTFLKLLDHVSLMSISSFLLAAVATMMIRVFYSVYVFSLVGVLYLYRVYLTDKRIPHIGILGAMCIIMYNLGTRLFPYGNISIDRINSLAQGIAHGGSAYLTTVYPSSFFDLIWYIPLQGAYFQFSPFIWDVIRISNPLTIIAFFQASLVILFLFVVYRKRASPIINWKFGLVLLVALSAPLVLGIGVKNAGAAVRWRLPTEILIISIASTVVDYEFLTHDKGERCNDGL